MIPRRRKRQRLFAYGHSWVAGRYPDRRIRPWPRQVASAIGRKLRNEGRGSAESPAIAAQIADLTPLESDVVAIQPMLNDLRHFGDSAEGLARYEAALTAMLEKLHSPPQGPRVFILLDPEITAWNSHPPFDQGSREARALYAGTTQRILESFPDAQALDLNLGWDCSTHLADDGVHPNGPGTRHIAEQVLTALENG